MAIHRLSEQCLNRIAAGEVLVRPLNAVKELLENSIDAESTNISITIGNGGMQTIQVLDNGFGIPVLDHPLVCARFATSKLVNFESLTDGTLSSFGFRGEALASMSLVGHVSIFSKRKEDSTGWESRYLVGNILPSFPVACSFPKEDNGTRVVVDDLFYDHPVKKRAFKKAEYRKILQLVMHFVVAYPKVHFQLKELGDVSWDLESPVGDRIDRISSIFNIPRKNLTQVDGAEIFFPLESFECVFASHNVSTLVLLVNGRLVEMPAWKDRLSGLVTGFVFVALTINKSQIDVNVNPTKRQVVFQNQAEILKWVLERISASMNTNTAMPVKMKPIVFGSGSSKESLVEKTVFRIHTCPTQLAFTQPEQSSPKLTLSQAGPSKRFRPTVDVPIETYDSKISGELSTKCFRPAAPIETYDSKISDELSIKYQTIGRSEGNLGNQLVFVGAVNTEFAICQYNQYLCLSNIAYLSKFLLKFFFLKKINFPLKSVSWASSVLSLLTEFVDPALVVLPTSSCCNVDVLDDFLETVSEIFLRENCENKPEKIFNEIIKNKTYLPIQIAQTRPAALHVNDSKNFFFREIISLKDLYKEFERC